MTQGHIDNLKVFLLNVAKNTLAAGNSMAAVVQSSLLEEDEEVWDCGDVQYVFTWVNWEEWYSKVTAWGKSC